jgi:ATP-dependent Clp protease ATP-binding subunit ClpC
MIERFSDQSRMLLVLGQEEARRLGHDEIGSDHMLLGLLKQPEDIRTAQNLKSSADQAATALAELGISLDAARNAVAEIRGHREAPTTGQLPLSADARNVLSEMLKAALSRDDAIIEPCHFLLAVGSPEKTVKIGHPTAASTVLDRLGVSIADLRRQLPG